MVKVWDLTGKVILETKDPEDRPQRELESDLPVLEGLVKSALFHPIDKFRNSALQRLSEASKLGKREGIGQVLAGHVQDGSVYIRVETVSGRVEDRYLFDVPKEIYEVKDPIDYPFVIGAKTMPELSPRNSPAA